jgi:hypothetical protein
LGGLVDEIKKMPLWTWIVGAGAVIAVVVLLLTAGGGDLSRLEGRWEGAARNQVDDFRFDVTFVFPGDCVLDEYCGRITIPQFELTNSSVKITKVRGSDYQFKLRINEDLPADELPYEYLRIIDDSTLEFHSKGEDWESEGTLTRQ